MRIAGVGSALPSTRVQSAEIEKQLGLEPGWIERRTGVRERPTASAAEATSDLALTAAAAAIADSGTDRTEVGLLLLATSTPDHLLPPTAPLVSFRLGLQAGAIDLAGACSGFVYALVFGSHWVDTSGKAAIVIGANILTRRVNPDDAATSALFSDGAGAVVIVPHQPTTLIGSYLGSDGAAYGSMGIPEGGSRAPLTPDGLRHRRNLMAMTLGSALFRQAVQGMARAGKEALTAARLSSSDIDLWIPHQANARIIRDVGASLAIPPERTLNVVASYGNSSAATIPIALAHAVQHGRLQTANKILFTAAGAGLITASAVVTWSK